MCCQVGLLASVLQLELQLQLQLQLLSLLQ
jgi:hypothetical protein